MLFSPKLCPTSCCRHAAPTGSILPCRTIRHNHRRLIIKNSSTNGNGNGNGVETSASAATTSSQPNPYNWTFDSAKPAKPDPKVQDIPVSAIRRPLGRTRSNGHSILLRVPGCFFKLSDQAKVDALMKSIMEIGLQEPIDVLLVDGQYYGFSGCHRYEAHQRLGLPTIKCRVRRANQQVLKMHMM